MCARPSVEDSLRLTVQGPRGEVTGLSLGTWEDRFGLNIKMTVSKKDRTFPRKDASCSDDGSSQLLWAV